MAQNAAAEEKHPVTEKFIRYSAKELAFAIEVLESGRTEMARENLRQLQVVMAHYANTRQVGDLYYGEDIDEQ